MKKIILFMFVLVANTTLSKAQILTFTASTGDLEMNNILTDIQNKAAKDITSFKNDVTKTFNVVNSKIEEALKILSPGDIYMAAQLSVTVNKPFEEVVKTYQANKSKGWGAIAKELGIKPGSPEFHAMKKSMKSKGNSKEKGNDEGEENGSGNDNGHGNGHGNNGHGNGKKK